MDKILIKAIETIHPPEGWVHLSTIGSDGGPHVTPMMMGIHQEGLLFSVTGKQKKRNLERDSRACVAISQPGVMDHVIVWGTIELRHDDKAQQMWNAMISSAFGEAGLEQRSRGLSIDATSLGVMTPSHHRIYGLT
jgi:general stress protein 26